MARKLGSAHPRGTTWNGAGGWLIVSQSRQATFSRMVWMTFHARGITSSVSVTSSPSFDRRVPPQAGHEHGAARKLGSAHPRGTTWNGAGGWLIVSQSRQATFSRMVWMTFHARGITSSVSVTSSPKRGDLVKLLWYDG